MSPGFYCSYMERSDNWKPGETYGRWNIMGHYWFSESDRNGSNISYMNIAVYSGHKASGQLGQASLDPTQGWFRETRQKSLDGFRKAWKPAFLFTAGPWGKWLFCLPVPGWSMCNNSNQTWASGAQPDELQCIQTSQHRKSDQSGQNDIYPAKCCCCRTWTAIWVKYSNEST